MGTRSKSVPKSLPFSLIAGTKPSVLIGDYTVSREPELSTVYSKADGSIRATRTLHSWKFGVVKRRGTYATYREVVRSGGYAVGHDYSLPLQPDLVEGWTATDGSTVEMIFGDKNPPRPPNPTPTGSAAVIPASAAAAGPQDLPQVASAGAGGAATIATPNPPFEIVGISGAYGLVGKYAVAGTLEDGLPYFALEGREDPSRMIIAYRSQRGWIFSEGRKGQNGGPPVLGDLRVQSKLHAFRELGEVPERIEDHEAGWQSATGRGAVVKITFKEQQPAARTTRTVPATASEGASRRAQNLARDVRAKKRAKRTRIIKPDDNPLVEESVTFMDGRFNGKYLTGVTVSPLVLFCMHVAVFC